MTDFASKSRIIVAAIAGVTAVTCVTILTGAYTRTRRAGELIRVTGSAHRTIRSDYIVWECTVTEESPTVSLAFNHLHSDIERTVTYLTKKGIASNEVWQMPVSTTELHPPVTQPNVSIDSSVRRPVSGYRLTQSVQVRSKAVEHVDEIARTSTELMSSGIPIESASPEFLYTGLDKLKLDLLKEASVDARNKAEGIAQSCGSHIRELRYARSGVTQVEALSATDGVTDSGANDTTSIDKKVTVVVRADFAVQ